MRCIVKYVCVLFLKGEIIMIIYIFLLVCLIAIMAFCLHMLIEDFEELQRNIKEKSL